MSSKNKLIINCQTTCVVAGEFSVAGGRLVLDNFKTSDLIYDYSDQNQWFSALTVALKSMRLTGKATVIVPSSMFLTKTIKVPSLGGSSQEDVIRFEASKAIPYDLSEVSWDYQEISRDEVESEILLISMRTTEANALCVALEASGVVPERLQASSVLDYNAWKFSNLEEDVSILNIGAKSSNLIIARQDGFFVRTIPLGGNALTQLVADSSGLSFDQAEATKKKFFSSSEQEQGHSLVSEQFKASAQNYMKRLSMELKRSILNYRRKPNIKAPSKIYLTGRGSLLKGLAEFLCEDQNINVDYFDTLANVTVGSKVNQALLNESSSQVSELIGEASGMLLASSIGVNLLPDNVVSDMAFRAKRPFMIIAAALLAIATVPPILVFNSCIDAFNSSKKTIDARVPEFIQRTRQIDDNRLLSEKYISKIQDLEILGRSKANWINLFVKMEERLVNEKDVWLDDLKVDRTGTGATAKYNLRLSGRLLIRELNLDDPEGVSKRANERVDRLLKSFTDQEFVFIQRVTDVTRDATDPRILKFTFTLVVNPDKPI